MADVTPTHSGLGQEHGEGRTAVHSAERDAPARAGRQRWQDRQPAHSSSNSRPPGLGSGGLLRIPPPLPGAGTPHLLPRARRHTGRTPSCAARNNCWSPSTSSPRTAP